MTTTIPMVTGDTNKRTGTEDGFERRFQRTFSKGNYERRIPAVELTIITNTGW